jgi:hypothetical protein
MNEVVESIKRVTDIMAEISAASQEQTQGIEQVNIAITEMDNVTQQNAALVEEAAAAAGSLQDESSHLAGLVSVFKLTPMQMRAAQEAIANSHKHHEKIGTLSNRKNANATTARIAQNSASLKNLPRRMIGKNFEVMSDEPLRSELNGPLRLQAT